MKSMLVYPAGSTKACQWAAQYLTAQGVPTVDHPTPDATHLLLDVPSLAQDGTLRGGGRLSALLCMLPHDITLVGGNLPDTGIQGHPMVDLLKDPEYLAKNAALTADCALRAAGKHLSVSYIGCPVLVIGWGRIGKVLSRLLCSMGADVTVAARNPADRAMLLALQYKALDLPQLPEALPGFRLIFNTVPSPVLDADDMTLCRNCTCIELASQKGLGGEHIIEAKGLPGIMTPESSGALICDTFLRIIGRK